MNGNRVVERAKNAALNAGCVYVSGHVEGRNVVIDTERGQVVVSVVFVEMVRPALLVAHVMGLLREVEGAS